MKVYLFPVEIATLAHHLTSLQPTSMNVALLPDDNVLLQTRANLQSDTCPHVDVPPRILVLIAGRRPQVGVWDVGVRPSLHNICVDRVV